jgi:AcrR family transcriptional regulator
VTTEPRTRRDEQAQQTRVRIVDAALEVYGRLGAARATTKEIALTAGVAQGLLYHYFRSKEELLEAVLERHSFLPKLRAILEDAAGRPAAEVMREVATQFAGVLREKEAIVDMFLGEGRRVPEVRSARTRLMGEGLRLFADYMGGRVAAGELRPHRIDVTARALMSAVLIMHVTDSLDPGAIDSLIDILLGGIRSPEAGPGEAPRQAAPAADDLSSNRRGLA